LNKNLRGLSQRCSHRTAKPLAWTAVQKLGYLKGGLCGTPSHYSICELFDKVKQLKSPEFIEDFKLLHPECF